MTRPERWVPGEKITAAKLNADQAEASRQRGSANFGPGSTLVNETMGNQSAHMRKSDTRLVFATEDFTASVLGKSTDLIYHTADPVPSGKCRQIRLNVYSGEYEQETKALEFRVYDPMSHLTSPGFLRSKGDMFYAIMNHDSMRWEVIAGGGGAKRIRFTVNSVICIGATVVSILARWTHYSGACGTIPPGVNYEGLIPVDDTCVFGYFTATSLLGKIGSASYWYNRDGYVCEGKWLVDDVCGAPECA